MSAIRQAESVPGVGPVERVELVDETGLIGEAETVNAVLSLRRSNSRSEIERLLDALQPS